MYLVPLSSEASFAETGSSESEKSVTSTNSAFSSKIFNRRKQSSFPLREVIQARTSYSVLMASTMEPPSDHLPREQEEEIVDQGEGGTAEEEQADGTVLFALRELRMTLQKELQGVKADMVKMLTMQTSLMGKMVVLDVAVQGICESGSMQTTTVVAGRKRRYRADAKLPLLIPTFNDSNAAIPLVQLACIITTTSASRRIPQLHGIVSDGVVNYLGTLQQQVGQATGLGVLMFAVRGNAAKTKFKFPTGQLWLFWIKRAMQAAVTYAKKHMYSAAEDENLVVSDIAGNSNAAQNLPKEPQWLGTLETFEHIDNIITEVVGRLEATDRVTPTTSSISNESGPPHKRLRSNEEEDAKYNLRFAAGMQIRGVFTAVLNHGRAEVRSYLYLTLLFIVDRIKEFSNRMVARSAGFDVVFGQAKSDEELRPSGLTGIWNIPLAEIGNPVSQRAEGSGSEGNLQALRALEEAFPSLSLEIKYQREVKQVPGAALDNEGRRLSVAPVIWPDSDKVSLHFVAANMLMELVSAKSIAMILAASKLSLRTVHLLAIGLRALLLRSLESVEKNSIEFAVTDVYLTELERNLVGNVVYDHIAKSADLVSVKMDELKAGGKQAVRLSTNREKKFVISYEEYTKALEDAERQRERAAATEQVISPVNQERAQVTVRQSNDDWLFGG